MKIGVDFFSMLNAYKISNNIDEASSSITKFELIAMNLLIGRELLF